MDEKEINQALIEKFLKWGGVDYYFDGCYIIRRGENKPIAPFTQSLDSIFKWIVEPCLPQNTMINLCPTFGEDGTRCCFINDLNSTVHGLGSTLALALCQALLEWKVNDG